MKTVILTDEVNDVLHSYRVTDEVLRWMEAYMEESPEISGFEVIRLCEEQFPTDIRKTVTLYVDLLLD